MKFQGLHCRSLDAMEKLWSGEIILIEAAVGATGRSLCEYRFTFNHQKRFCIALRQHICFLRWPFSPLEVNDEIGYRTVHVSMQAGQRHLDSFASFDYRFLPYDLP